MTNTTVQCANCGEALTCDVCGTLHLVPSVMDDGTVLLDQQTVEELEELLTLYHKTKWWHFMSRGALSMAIIAKINYRVRVVPFMVEWAEDVKARVK